VTERKALILVICAIALIAMLYSRTSTPNKTTSSEPTRGYDPKIAEREPALVALADKPCKRALNVENSSFGWSVAGVVGHEVWLIGDWTVAPGGGYTGGHACRFDLKSKTVLDATPDRGKLPQ
jgi:hypothetical protein